MLPGETLTDAAGRFALDLTVSNTPALVWTRDGRREKFLVEHIAPGEHRADYRWRLRDVNLLELDLRGPGGTLAKDRIDSPPEGTWVVSWRKLSFQGQVVVGVGLQDGTLLDLSSRPDPDGILRLQLDVPLAHIRSCDVLAPGYVFQRAELPSGLEAGTRLVLELSERPCLVLEVRWAQTSDAPTKEPLNLTLQACLGWPQAGELRDPWHSCCGLGGALTKTWTGEGSFELPVQLEDEPYWIIVSGNGPESTLAHSAYGPFVASEGPRRIELPGDLLQSEASAPEGSVVLVNRLQDLGFPSVEDTSGSVFRGRLLLADGSPPPDGTHLGAESSYETPDADGRFELRGELPESFTLFVTEGENSYQGIRIQAWTPGQELELRMAPWRDVIVRLQGLDERHLYSALNLSTSIDAFIEAGGRELAPEGAVRRFAFRVAAGQHTLQVFSALYELGSRQIFVEDKDSASAQVIDVAVRRK